MDLTGTFITGIISIIGYVLLFVGVYKIFQIATDVKEIKEMLKSGRRSGASTGEAAVGFPKTLGEDSADAYAESLLRAVNAESPHATGQSDAR